LCGVDRICKFCFQDAKAKKLPSKALVCGFFCGKVPEQLANPLLVKAANETGVLVVHTGFMRPQNEGWGLFARCESGFRSGQDIVHCGSFDLKAADVIKLLE
jgi:hypothetical protein